MKRPRILGKILTLLAILVIAFIGLVVYFLMPGQKKLYIVSPETTFVTGPLDADGFVDYVAALNERLRGDIKPEQNANVLIWQAIGPNPDGNSIPPRYFEWLGSPAPTAKGEYFIDWKSHVDKEIDASFLQMPWKSEDVPFYANYVKRNKKPLEVFAKATKLPEFYHPIVPYTNERKRELLISSVNSNLVACKGVAELFACRAMMHLGDDRPSDAWEDLLCCHRLGRILQKGGTNAELLIGTEIERIAITAEQSYFEHVRPKKALLEKCRNDLERLPPASKNAEKVIFSERIIIIDVIEHVAKWGIESIDHVYIYLKSDQKSDGGDSKTESIDWDAAMRLANSWFDRMVTIKQIDDYQSRIKQTDIFLQEFNETKNRLIDQKKSELMNLAKTHGERSAVILVSPRWPSFKSVNASDIRTRQMAINLDVMIALSDYRLDHGKYPATLAELSPKLLAKIPNDLFSGLPLKYEVTSNGYLLYSVGPNLLDEKGRCTENNQPGEDDVTIKLPREEPIPEPDEKD